MIKKGTIPLRNSLIRKKFGPSYEKGFTYVKITRNSASSSGSGGYIIGTNQFNRGAIRLKGYSTGYIYKAGTVQVIFDGASWKYASLNWEGGGATTKLEIKLLFASNNFGLGSTYGPVTEPLIESQNCNNPNVASCLLPKVEVSNSQTNNAYDLELKDFQKIVDHPTVYTGCVNQFSSKATVIVPTDSVVNIYNNYQGLNSEVLFQG